MFNVQDGEEDSIKSAKEIIGPVAEHFSKEDSPVIFFYTICDETAESLSDFIQVSDDNSLVILDIPSQKLYECDDVLTREGVEKFVRDFASGKLEGKQLKG